MNPRQKVNDQLAALDIPWRLTEHPAVYTMEEMATLGLDKKGVICKNLFIQEGKGKRFFLIVIAGDKRADLKSIRQQIASGPLRMGSEEQLAAKLGLTKGTVTPLGILNDKESTVEILMDETCKDLPTLGVHPNDNTATLWLSFREMQRIITASGNPLRFVQIL